MRSKKFLGIPLVAAIALIVAVTIVVVVVAAATLFSTTIHNTVTIVATQPGPGPTGANISATYAIDGGSSTVLASSSADIDWGSITQGSSQTMLITFTNTGDVSATEAITLPTSSNGCTFTANTTSVNVPAGGSNTVTITLAIAANATNGSNIAAGDIGVTGT